MVNAGAIPRWPKYLLCYILKNSPSLNKLVVYVKACMKSLIKSISSKDDLEWLFLFLKIETSQNGLEVAKADQIANRYNGQ